MSISINLDRRLKAVAKTSARSVKISSTERQKIVRKTDKHKERQTERKTER
jgi:hypothetical protein